jgi:hypothetical protein
VNDYDRGKRDEANLPDALKPSMEGQSSAYVFGRWAEDARAKQDAELHAAFEWKPGSPAPEAGSPSRSEPSPSAGKGCVAVLIVLAGITLFARASTRATRRAINVPAPTAARVTFNSAARGNKLVREIRKFNEAQPYRFVTSDRAQYRVISNFSCARIEPAADASHVQCQSKGLTVNGVADVVGWIRVSGQDEREADGQPLSLRDFYMPAQELRKTRP